MRAIFEALGAKVEWDQTTRTVTAFRPDQTYAGFLGDKTITLTIGKNTAHLVSIVRERPENSRDEDIVLDVPAQMINDRTMIPLRFISETLDAHVQWNKEALRVDIYTPEIKEYWYQYDPVIEFRITERYDLWTYEEPEELDFIREQVYLRTIKYGDENRYHFYSFMVKRIDLTRYGEGIERHEMEASGFADDKHWYITFVVYELDDETRELENWYTGKTQMDVVYENGNPVYDWIPFSVAVSYFVPPTSYS